MAIPQPVVVDSGAAARATSAFLPAFQALQGALADGEEAMARRILDGVLARGPRGDDLALADDFGRILRGRELVRGLDLHLSSAPADEEGYRRLFLVLRQTADEPLQLRLPPGKLRRRRTAIDPDGFAHGDLDTSLVPELSDLTIPPGVELTLALSRYFVPMGRAMALRDRWSLDVLSGEIHVGDEPYPAVGIRITPVEADYLASFLSAQAVEPEVLVEYLRREEIHLPPLLERTVRIAPGRRDEALAALLPVLRDPATAEEERMAMIAPALRWLSGSTEPGVDPRAWIRYLEAHLAPSSPEGEGRRPVLDLPDTAGAASAIRTRDILTESE